MSGIAIDSGGGPPRNLPLDERTDAKFPFANAPTPRERPRMSRDDASCKTPSPAKPHASAGGSSRGRPSDALFKTITSDDWRRSLASARRQKNAVSEQIQTAISSSSRKTK